MVMIPNRPCLSVNYLIQTNYATSNFQPPELKPLWYAIDVSFVQTATEIAFPVHHPNKKVRETKEERTLLTTHKKPKLSAIILKFCLSSP